MAAKLSLFFFLVAAGSLAAAEGAPAADGKKPPEAEKTAVVISSLPENIKLIVGQGKEDFYVPRVRAIHELSPSLSDFEIQACYEFLARKIESQKLPDLQFNGLKNELVWALAKQQKKPADLAALLVKMYNDKSYDVTWRDYCVQFFGKLYPVLPDNQGRKDMVAGLWDALKNERGSRIAGAAGAQLCFLANRHPEFDKAKVSAACLEALTDPKCADISKVALLHVCATLGNEKALPTARALAATGRNVILRASAIAAVGALGDQSDLKLLRELEASKDIRLQRPAVAAMEKILKKSNVK